MLQRLFSAWNPGGTPAAGGGRPGAGLQQLPARSDGDPEQLHRARGAAWNSAADAMVQANPDKYSYVNTSDYIKGADY